jgi:hypothetical protein
LTYKARCSCGALSLSFAGPPEMTVACHCIDCQRRTGSPFGVGAYYRAERVEISGHGKEIARSTAMGGTMRNYFWDHCGSTVYWRTEKFEGMIGVAVGAIADPGYPGPDRSVWEQWKHHWVEIGPAHEHRAKGTGGTS